MSGIENGKGTDIWGLGLAANWVIMAKNHDPNGDLHKEAVSKLSDLLADCPEAVIDAFVKQQTE